MEALQTAFEENLVSTQRMLNHFMQRLQTLMQQPEGSEEAWEQWFGSKESPLSALQKLVSMQKVTQELASKQRAFHDSALKHASAKTKLKAEDWEIIEMALMQHKQDQAPSTR